MRCNATPVPIEAMGSREKYEEGKGGTTRSSGAKPSPANRDKVRGPAAKSNSLKRMPESAFATNSRLSERDSSLSRTSGTSHGSGMGAWSMYSLKNASRARGFCSMASANSSSM